MGNNQEREQANCNDTEENGNSHKRKGTGGEESQWIAPRCNEGKGLDDRGRNEEILMAGEDIQNEE